MNASDFLSVSDFSPREIEQVLLRARRMKDGDVSRPLDGKIVAMLFEHPSLRTRVSFEVGIRQLGGECFYLSKDDVGLGEREPVADVARVLERWVDGIVARVFSHEGIPELAEYAGVPVVNALSDAEHPCQAMADLLTIQEHKGTLEGIRVAFIGDGNNVAASLALACASVGAEIVVASPPEYQVPGPLWEEAKELGAMHGSGVKWVELPQHAVRGSDVVYTDVWASMGQEDRRRAAAEGTSPTTRSMRS